MSRPTSLSHRISTPTSRTGVLLIGHGTRDADGLREFSETAALVAQRLAGCEVATAFLEFAEPTIDESVSKLVSLGMKNVVFVPVLLFAAGHAKRDIPLALQAAQAKHSQVHFSLAQTLGCHPELLLRSRETWSEAWTKMESSSSGAQWILVGRGSLDVEATEETHRYATMLSRHVDHARFHVAFLSMAEPRMEDVLDQVLAGASGPVLAIPHLLFQGDLLREFYRRVDDAGRKYPDVVIRAARHLGPSPRVASAIADLAGRHIEP